MGTFIAHEKVEGIGKISVAFILFLILYHFYRNKKDFIAFLNPIFMINLKDEQLDFSEAHLSLQASIFISYESPFKEASFGIKNVWVAASN